MRYAVVGHFTPTDAEIQENWPGQEGKLDKDVTVQLRANREDAEVALSWFPDGVIVEVKS